MDKEKFDRAYAIRLEIGRIKEEKMLEDVDVDAFNIEKIVIVVRNGPELVINSEEIMSEMKALIKSELARYDEEIAKLEKEFNAL